MSADAPTAILEINNIEVVYNHTIQVLRGLSLSVQTGQIVALLGSNGAGKSTTLKAASNMLGLERGAINAGSICFDGSDIETKPPHALVRSGLFHVMEGRRIFPDLTVDENLTAATYALAGRDKAQADFDSVFEYFPRLRERRTGLAGYLSGGEQQMLALGRALIARPKLILMDEPSMGLSPLLVKEVFGIIRRLNDELGITILLVEQNARMALSVASHAYIMEQGKVVLDGTAAALADNEDVKEFYLGGHGAERRSFKNLKSYKRRKRWL